MIRRVMILTALLFSVYAAVAQAPQEPAKPKTPPVLSDKVKADYYRAQMHIKQAQEMQQVAQAEFKTMGEEFAKACGDDYQPQIDPNGDPICGLKPSPAPSTPPKK